MLKLSNTAVGSVKSPRRWDNAAQGYLDLDPKQMFMARLHNRQMNYKTGTVTQSLFYRDDSIPDGQAYHKNYMEYLSKCWADHLGIVITPDIIWYTLLCELAAIVKGEPETYRYLFTNSPDKQDVLVCTSEPVVMPMQELIDEMRYKVPTDVHLFMPEFSTGSLRTKHACNAAFADMCSPYYNYMMYCCGFPHIEVRGTADDWSLLVNSWKQLNIVIDKAPKKVQTWAANVGKVLQDIADNLASPAFWTKMFTLVNCGSGGQVEVSGWFSTLFLTTPDVRYPENYAPHVSEVKYRNLDLKRDYKMNVGLLFSKAEGDLLVPNYGFVVQEQLSAPVSLTVGKDGIHSSDVDKDFESHARSIGAMA